MFYKTGVDITNDRQMFEFLKGHFSYYTMNSWNRVKSIANNVKLYNLNLSGDWSVVYDFLENGEYETIHFMIQDWEYMHKGYKVFFNGRSNGYLVLGETTTNNSIFPYCIEEADTYEEYKALCKQYYGSVKAFRNELVYFTKLVQDFDKLCDSIRDFCNNLSQLDFRTIEMEKVVDEFNENYTNDLELLGFQSLTCDTQGRANISEIWVLRSLFEAFIGIANRQKGSYELNITDAGLVAYK